MSLSKRVRAICRNRRRTDIGAVCLFFKLNKQTGVKLYETRRNAILTYNLQTRAATAGLAPPIQSKIFAVRCNPWKADDYGYHRGESTFYAYLVGIADLSTTELVRHSSRYKRELRELQDRLFEAGFDCGDMHPGNWGYYRNRLVCIDFSHFKGTRDELVYV